MEKLREEAKERKIKEAEELLPLLKELLIRQLSVGSRELAKASGEPTVVMIVGVNGAGKTTTAGKLAAKEAKAGRKVLLAAADTFRAGAIEQLKIWAERAGAQLIHHQEGSDPAAVAFDAIAAAKSRGIDTVFVDTAGRLQNKVNLMAELEKVKRVMGKAQAGAPTRCSWFWTPQQAKTVCPRLGSSTRLWTFQVWSGEAGRHSQRRHRPCHPKGAGSACEVHYVGEGIEDLRPFDLKSLWKRFLKRAEKWVCMVQAFSLCSSSEKPRLCRKIIKRDGEWEMIWKEKYRIGVSMIDKQHQELFRRWKTSLSTCALPASGRTAGESEVDHGVHEGICSGALPR